MAVRLRFMGAAQNVTGSRYLLDVNESRILVDCGLYQERDLRHRNWDPFFVPPESLDAVLLTHAHLDHSGLLPKLVREGFRGRVYCTAATADIVQIVLADAAHLQEEDAEFKRRRHEREGRKGPYPEVPLYTTADAARVQPLLSPVSYEEPVQVNGHIEATFHDVGHILGASSISVKVSDGGRETSILFSGDVGRWDKPILQDPTLVERADYVLVESTYGDRTHPDQDGIAGELAEVVNSTRRAGGNLLVPSFALERTQEVLYYLNQLLMEDRIPHLMAFVDSPMAVSVTEVFQKHRYLFDEEMAELLRRNESPFDFPGLKLVRSVDDSKAINHITGTAIIIAGSGMCTGGRIKHHLVANISRPESTVLFVGYQAFGTLGRTILDGAKEVRILGKMYPVRAKVAQISGFSAHGDRDELFRWLSGFERSPKHVFVTHGEPEPAQSFATLLREKNGWDVSVPSYKDVVALE